MHRTDRDLVYRISFAELTPQVFVGDSQTDPLYVRAYLSREADTENEYKRNTTTWD